MRKTFVSICVAVAIAACSAKTWAPTNEQLVQMKQKVPGITLEEARSGSKLYSEKCARCHRLYPPEKYTEAQWNGILPKMFLKARVSNNEQQELLTDYLRALSR